MLNHSWNELSPEAPVDNLTSPVGKVTEAQNRCEMLEMVLQNSSYGHEYTMLKLSQTQSYIEQQALHQKLESYRKAYFEARQYLKQNAPQRLQTLEADLIHQKANLFKTYHA